MRNRWCLLIALALVLPVACGSFGSDPGSGGGDGGAGGGEAAASASGACPGTHGPVALRVGAYCIDATEVTRGQYAEFLAAPPSDRPTPIDACKGNTSFEPARDWPPAPGEETYPVGGVDWCDANDFCRWAGKRLCGRIGGGPIAPNDRNDATKDQWFAACSANGTKDYPYGTTYDASACNGAERTPNEQRPREVKSLPTCEGGASALFDMTGNIWEWEDACSGAGADATCYIRGGDFAEHQDTLSCGTYVSQPRTVVDGRFGFRCCAD